MKYRELKRQRSSQYAPEAERLLHLLGEIDDRYLGEAAPASKKSAPGRQVKLPKWIFVAAACFFLAIGGGFMLLAELFTPDIPSPLTCRCCPSQRQPGKIRDSKAFWPGTSLN